MILHFRLSICSLGKITVIWTMLGGRASMEHFSLLHIVSFCEGKNKKPEGFAKQKQPSIFAM